MTRISEFQRMGVELARAKALKPRKIGGCA